MWYFSGKGDEGETSLKSKKRISKSDPVFDLIGKLDETIAFLGLAISLSNQLDVCTDLEKIQDIISQLLGSVAGADDKKNDSRFEIDEGLVWAESRMNYYGCKVDKPESFVFAGKTQSGAVIDISRTIIRESERLLLKSDPKMIPNKKNSLALINRLSSLLFVLRLFVEKDTTSLK